MLTYAKNPLRALFLCAALLAGLACSLFRSEPPVQPPTSQPPTAGPTAAASDQRPADFSARYYWREGSLAPPYHYEYSIDVAADGTVTLTYIPDYPSADAPTWIETVSLDAAQLDELYAELRDFGLFTTDWQTVDGPPVGGSSDTLSVTANGGTVEVPSYVITEQAADAAAMAETMKALIPQATWEALETQRQQYIAEHTP